eukprot:3495295-Rhodomonas_salina.2
MTRIGKMIGLQSGISGTNKTVRHLWWAVKQLSHVVDKLSTHQPLLTSSMGYHQALDLCSLYLDEVFERYGKGGQRKAQEREKWDPIWRKAFEYDTFSGVDLAFPDQGFTQQHFQLVLQGFERGLERVEKAMACARLTDWKQTNRDSLCKGNKKEVKRHFDKLPPPPKLRKVGCKHVSKQYPGILETTWPGVAALASHLGAGLPQLLHARGGSLSSTTWTHFQSRDFLCSLPAGDFPLALKAQDKPVLYTHASYRSAQIEYYVSQECTSQRLQCQTCLSTMVYPLSSDVQGDRTIRWWCRDCRDSTTLSFAPATMDTSFLRSLTLRRFTGWRFLTLPLTDTDCEYLFRHLPLGRAVGRDVLPY